MIIIVIYIYNDNGNNNILHSYLNKSVQWGGWFKQADEKGKCKTMLQGMACAHLMIK